MYFILGLIVWITGLVHSSFLEECIQLNQRNENTRSIAFGDVNTHCAFIMKAVTHFPWTGSYRDIRSLLLNDVAPFVALTEPPLLDPEIREAFRKFVWDLSLESECDTVECISLLMNEKIWSIRDPPVIFSPAQPNELNSYGIEETLFRGNGSCTAMSVFLVTALRMAGVPSRIVGVPHWNLGPMKCPLEDESPECGNHNWVEVFVHDKGWSFLDQRRADLKVLPLNTSWFYPEWTSGVDIPHRGNHSIYASSFIDPNELGGDYPIGFGVDRSTHFPMVWDMNDNSVRAFDVSVTYRNRERENNIQISYDYEN
jgi:hypothetical protein